jgi:hypothetical protein
VLVTILGAAILLFSAVLLYLISGLLRLHRLYRWLKERQ